MDIQIPQIIFQIINFGVVFIGVSYLLSKPIQKILSERAEKIAEGQKAAAVAIEEKEKIEVYKKQAKKNADKQAAQLVAETQKKAEDQARVIVTDAKTIAKKEIEKMKSDWEKQKHTDMKKAKQDMAAAIIKVSEKVVGEKLVSKSDEELINNELDTLIAKA